MRKPEFITFTGIDDRTDLKRADYLARLYPIEWGVLFSTDNQDARFPCAQAVNEILDINGSMSAHLCGAMSRQAQSGIAVAAPLESFDRVQVNGKSVNTANLYDLKNEFDIEIILQSRSDKFEESDFHQLFDLSGGRGERPQWIPPIPTEGNLVGYAGGIGPETVVGYLNLIDGNAPYWIDMESGIRSEGWFNLDRVERVCELVFR